MSIVVHLLGFNPHVAHVIIQQLKVIIGLTNLVYNLLNVKLAFAGLVT